jgi:hypothetical protein
MSFEFKNGEIKYNSGYGYYIGNYNSIIRYTLRDIKSYEELSNRLELGEEIINIPGSIGIHIQLSLKKDHVLAELYSKGVLNYILELHPLEIM